MVVGRRREVTITITTADVMFANSDGVVCLIWDSCGCAFECFAMISTLASALFLDRVGAGVSFWY